MLKQIPRPSPGFVIACLALFASLAGVAGALPGKNTVNGGDVKNDSLTGKDVKESTLKLSAATLQSALKISVYHQDVGALADSGSPGHSGGATAACPEGKQAIAGGGLSDATSTQALMTDTRPSQGPAGSAPGGLVNDGESFSAWRASWNNADTNPVSPVVYVVCVG